MRKLFALLAGVGLLTVSCGDYDDTDLVNRIDDMDKRLTSLEETIALMNQDIKGVQTLVDALGENYYVSRIEPADNGYTLFFTNGEDITISSGTVTVGGGGTGVTIVLDPEDGLYYWAPNRNGKTEYIVVDGKRLPVAGEAGKTPQLRVNKVGAVGYWEYRYSDDEEWQRLKDDEGNDVTTSGGGGGLFESVEVVEDEDGNEKVVFTFLGGEEKIEIELRGDLYINFKGKAPEGALLFNVGQTRTFDMLAVGVQKAVVTKPDEWSASYDVASAVLTITAPTAKHITDGCAADKGEVSIIYFGEKNDSSVITIQVATGEVVTIDDDKTSIEAPVAGDTYTIPFVAGGNVTATTADAWLSATVSGSDIQIVVEKNKGAERTGTVTVSAKDNSIEITVSQEAGVPTQAKGIRPGSGVKKYKIAPANQGFTDVVKTSSIAAVGEYIIVNAPGENPRVFKAEDGSFVKEFELNGAPNDLITSDGADHIILCNYNKSADTDFTIYRAKDIDSAPELLATYVGGNPVGMKISVTGDVYGDAVIMIPYSQWISGGNRVYWIWEIKDGVAVGEKPVWKRMNTDIISYQQNIDMVAANPSTTSDFFFIGYSGSTLHWMGADYSIKAQLPVSEATALSNYIPNAIDAKVESKWQT